MRTILLVMTVWALILTSGCAYTNSKLDLRYDEAKASRGPLSSIGPVRIKIDSLQDMRNFTDRIGDKKNGLGADCADIVTTTPVPDLIKASIAAMMQKNGHNISEGQADIVVTGTIETFWVESQINFWTMEFMGTADVNLQFRDASTEALLLSKKYSGHHNEQFYTAMDNEVKSVMNATLEDLMNSISTDPKVLEALKRYSKNQQALLLKH